MSKWKTGKEIIDEEGIKEIEFFDDYVRKGLQPHNELGRPITPSGILKPDTKEKLSAEKRHRSESIEDPTRDTMEKIRRTFDPIARKKELEDSWNVFELPEDDSKAVGVLNKLRDSLYDKDNIKNFRGSLNLGKEKKKPTKAMRQSAKDMLEIQRVAKELYDKHPEYHPEINTYGKMFERKEIQDAGGKHYQLGTVQKWISKIAPEWAKQQGIRPKKK